VRVSDKFILISNDIWYVILRPEYADGVSNENNISDVPQSVLSTPIFGPPHFTKKLTCFRIPQKIVDISCENVANSRPSYTSVDMSFISHWTSIIILVLFPQELHLGLTCHQ
jgi:hypothetical protein